MKLPLKISELGEVMQMAYVPGDFHATLKFWIETMGAGPFFVMAHMPTQWAEHRGKPTNPEITAAFGHWDDMQIEIIEQHNDAPSPYQEWRAAGKEGLQHICIVVEDIVKAREICTKAGCDVIFNGRAGETHWSYVEVDGLGCMLEMVQYAPEGRQMMAGFREAARDWDGRDPIRMVKMS